MAASHRLSRLSATALAGFDDGDRVVDTVVALSGGADSAVLAWAAGRARDSVRAVHVHHGWAGSNVLEAAARRVADQLAMSLDVVRVTVPAGASPEAHARDARYRALVETSTDAERVAVGHTMDDQAETVLGNLLRGTGVRGIGGMARLAGRIERPLLGARRAEVRELATLLGLGFCDDPTNVDLRMRRNFLRAAVLGEVETSFHPAAVPAISRLAELAAVDDAHLEAESAERAPDPTVVPVLAGLSPALRTRAVRRAMRAAGVAHGGTHDDVLAVESVIAGGSPVTVSGGFGVSVRGARLVIAHRDRATDRPRQTEGDPAYLGSLVGTVRWGRWRFEGVVGSSLPAFPQSPWHAVFDADRVTAAQIGIVQPGGKVAFRGGTKAVADALAEGGVSAADRPLWPVVSVDGDVVWLPGVRRGASGWIDGRTRRYLWVTAVREEP